MTTNSNNFEIKIFQAIQKNLAFMGLMPIHKRNEHRKFSSREIILAVAIALDAASVFSSILLETNGLVEYMDVIYSLLCEISVLIAFISLMFKKDIGFDAMELYGEEITRSKCKCFIFFILDSLLTSYDTWNMNITTR